MSIKVTKHTILLCNFCGTGQEMEADGKGWTELRSMTKKKGKRSVEHACIKCTARIEALKPTES
jgi:predicted molibdopterin-dependent oxidoreductase YjgC